MHLHIINAHVKQGIFRVNSKHFLFIIFIVSGNLCCCLVPAMPSEFNFLHFHEIEVLKLLVIIMKLLRDVVDGIAVIIVILAFACISLVSGEFFLCLCHCLLACRLDNVVEFFLVNCLDLPAFFSQVLGFPVLSFLFFNFLRTVLSSVLWVVDLC